MLTRAPFPTAAFRAIQATDGNTATRATPYLQFTVPALAAGESITAATLGVQVTNASGLFLLGPAGVAGEMYAEIGFTDALKARLGVTFSSRVSVQVNTGNAAVRDAEAVVWHGRDQSLSLTLPPLATIVLMPVQA